MSITAVASYAYMYYASVPSPLGTRPVLFLLITRAVCGFMGVYGLYYSVQYLPLSEATVITFLAPILTCYACSLLIPGETFSRRQQAAGIVSLVGVVLIARPFRDRKGEDEGTGSYHHVLATVVAFFGVLGAAGAYTSIRMIGRRAHPLVSVTYFSSVTTVISAVAMLAIPSVPFRFPSNPTEWILLTGLGVCGFLLQFLLTAGLSYVPPADVGGKTGQGSRATSMVYTQVLFALFYDKVVWGSTLSLVSWAGSALILACAIAVAVMQEKGEKKVDPVTESVEEQERYKDADADEEA
jgi:drug/metabolite transporter (DMT)-like permease